MHLVGGLVRTMNIAMERARDFSQKGLHMRLGIRRHLQDGELVGGAAKQRSRASLLWTPITGLAIGVAAVAGWNAGIEAKGSGTGVAAILNVAGKADGDKNEEFKFFDEIVEVKHLISQLYVDAPDNKKLREGAIKGMVEALDDPYTVYVPASDQREFNKNLTGEYVGIGAQVNTASGWLTIVSPMEDTPAFRAGLMPEDKVLEIDGVTTQGLAVEACVDKLMGKANTPVTLKVDRGGQVLEVTIVREKIKTRSVKGVHRMESDPSSWDYVIDHDSNIAYVRLTQFTPRVAEEVLAALRSAGALREGSNGLGGLILDLRFNPGGLLEEAAMIADFFLKDGVIVSTKGRAHEERVARAQGPGTLPDFPIVVMVNGDSASASEILAGALADNDRAIVLGERSFGKGSVQSLRTLENGVGSELKITEQAYYLPSGRNITRKDDSAVWGVDPSDGFYVPMTDREVIGMIGVRRKLELLSVKNAEAKAKEVAVNSDDGEEDAPNSELLSKLDSLKSDLKIGEPIPEKKEEAPRVAPRVNDVVLPDEQHWDDVEWVLSTLKDKQLTAAVRAMQGRIKTGEWDKTGEKGPVFSKIEVDQLSRTRQYRERLIREIIRQDKRIEVLETSSKGQEERNAKDLWPDEVNLTDGTLEVRDKDGKLITTLKITGNNVERWLMDADVEKTPGHSCVGAEDGAEKKALEEADVIKGLDRVARTGDDVFGSFVALA